MEKLLMHDEDGETLFLCRPCAEKMKDMKSVKHIKVGAHKKSKGECEQCCCRRYGYECKVVFNYDFNNEKTTKRGI